MTETNIHLAGVQINFNTWASFNLEDLTNDGVVLFQYLVFHCQSNHQWTHSDNDLRTELGIKRGRIETIRDKFVQMGFLQTEIVKDANDNNIRAYSIDFNKLASLPVLSQVYRTKSLSGVLVDLKPISEIYKAIATKQPKSKGKTTSTAKTKKVNNDYIRQLAVQFESNFKTRRDYHNSNLSGKKRTAAGFVKFSPRHLNQLRRAVNHFDGNTNFMHNAWLAYCDILNNYASGIITDDERQLLPEGTIRDPISYFLTYSSAYGETGYNVIYKFGSYYAANYGRGPL